MKFETAIVVILLLVCFVVVGGLAWDIVSKEMERMDRKIERVEDCCEQKQKTSGAPKGLRLVNESG